MACKVGLMGSLGCAQVELGVGGEGIGAGHFNLAKWLDLHICICVPFLVCDLTFRRLINSLYKWNWFNFVSHGCSESKCAEEILAMFWWIEVEAILDCAQLNPGMKGNVDRYW